MTHELALDPAELTPPLQPVSGTGTSHRPALRVADDKPRVDLDAAELAAADFLAALGIDIDRDGLRETPARMARGPTRNCSTPGRCS